VNPPPVLGSADFEKYILWFQNYIQSFHSSDPRVQNHIDEKRSHTFRVVDLIEQIAYSLNLTIQNVIIAKIIALFHDVARFLQLQKYGTFFDAKSFDHGRMAVQILQENHILDHFSPSIQQLIFTAITNHNLAVISNDIPLESLKFTHMIRDADKLDIYNVVLDYYKPDSQRIGVIDFDFPDLPQISDPVYQAIIHRQVIRFNELHTLNDLKIMQLGWVFDLNFPHSFRILQEKQYLTQIYQTMKPTPQGEFVYRQIVEYLNKQCQ